MFNTIYTRKESVNYKCKQDMAGYGHGDTSSNLGPD